MIALLDPVKHNNRAVMQPPEDSLAKLKNGVLPSMVHQLKTNLHGIHGMLQLLGRSSSEDERQNFIHFAEQGTDCINKLIDDLQMYVNVQLGCENVRDISFGTLEMMQAMIRRLSSQFEESPTSLELAIADDFPIGIFGAAEHLSRLLEIILVHAIHQASGNAVSIALTVTDTPPGPFMNFCATSSGKQAHSKPSAPHHSPCSAETPIPVRKCGDRELDLALAHALADSLNGSLVIHPDSAPEALVELSIPFKRATEVS